MLKEERKEQAEQANKTHGIQDLLQKALNAAQTYQDMAAMSGNANAIKIRSGIRAAAFCSFYECSNCLIFPQRS